MIRRNERQELSAEMTLPEFYRAYVFPLHREARDADPKTIALDRVAMRYWSKFTGDPPLGEIDEFVTADFVAGLKTLPGRRGKPLAKSTIAKHCIHAQFVLDRAGPRSRRMRNAARLIPEPPGIEKPKPSRSMRPPLTLKELAAWIDASANAGSPKLPSVDPVAWWRALILTGYNTALRIDCMMRLEWSMLQPDNWLDIPAEIFKGGEHGGLFYLNSAAAEALKPLRNNGHDRIFPFRNWPRSSSWLQEQRRRQWRIAEIDQPGCGFHALRRSALTWLAGKNDLVARLVAGHAAGGDMLAGHYVDKKQVVSELLEQLPQPGGTNAEIDQSVLRG